MPPLSIYFSCCLKVRAHFPELRSGRSSLVVIDGEMKSLTSEFIEQVRAVITTFTTLVIKIEYHSHLTGIQQYYLRIH